MPSLVSIKTEIICTYCKKPYKAYKKGRSHCRNRECRAKEIKKQLERLEYFIGLFCNNKIEATIEFRFPGNDKMSQDAKIISISYLKDGLQEYSGIDNEGIDLQNIIEYFRPVLWKGVKGNFVIKTLNDGTIDPRVMNETFTAIEDPLIIGNNLIIKGQAENINKEGSNNDDN